jgi:hypothetical protein
VVPLGRRLRLIRSPLLLAQTPSARSQLSGAPAVPLQPLGKRLPRRHLARARLARAHLHLEQHRHRRLDRRARPQRLDRLRPRSGKRRHLRSVARRLEHRRHLRCSDRALLHSGHLRQRLAVRHQHLHLVHKQLQHLEEAVCLGAVKQRAAAGACLAHRLLRLGRALVQLSGRARQDSGRTCSETRAVLVRSSVKQSQQDWHSLRYGVCDCSFIRRFVVEHMVSRGTSVKQVYAVWACVAWMGWTHLYVCSGSGVLMFMFGIVLVLVAVFASVGP